MLINFYLHALGVKARFRRQGVGSRLLAHGLAMADQAQMPTYLENSNEANLSLYQKHGFEVIEKADTPNGGPPIWFMYRSPMMPNI
ncbi:MAG: GNAT family N-acetyltransferase [Cyanobacteria bacterium P01_H01_bin.15]